MPFPIVLAQDIPSAAEEGQLLRFTALRDFKIGDDVIVPKGASVSGAIAEGAKKKFIFNSGKMTLRLIEAAGVTGNKIRVRATVVPRADGTSTRPVETGVKKPRDLAAARGTEYFAYIDGDQSVPARK